MSSIKNLKKKRTELETVFPELTILEIAQLIQAEGSAISAKVTKKQKPVPTIAAVIALLRKRVLQVELERPRAKVQPDGSIKLKDTTTYRTYETNWIRLEELHGDLPIDQLTEEFALEFCSYAMRLAKKTYAINAKCRRAKGLSIKEETGHHAYNRALDTLATIVSYGIKKGLLANSPLSDIKRKAISESDRHGLTPEQVEEILSVALRGGRDPQLEYLMLWTIIETACRSGGLIKLQLQDLDSKDLMIRFHEKGGKSRKQPVSQALMQSLISLAKSRGVTSPTDYLLSYKYICECAYTSKSECECKSHQHSSCSKFSIPVSPHSFEKLWKRLGEKITWVAEKQISNHWLRHTTLTWVDRATSSNSIASKYAGHGPATVTAGYTSARKEEIRQAHDLLFKG